MAGHTLAIMILHTNASTPRAEEFAEPWRHPRISSVGSRRSPWGGLANHADRFWSA